MILISISSIAIINPLSIFSAEINGDSYDIKNREQLQSPTGGIGKDERKPGDKSNRRTKRHGVFTIGEIIVKGESIANIDQAATSTELTAKDLAARGNRTLDEALSAVQGVQVQLHQKGIMRVKIRGFDQEKIAILVDGMPVADVYSTDIDISDISVKNISRIYVNRGVSSALYGSSGAIGSINIVSEKPDKLFAQGSAEYGLYNNYIFNAALGGLYKNFYGWITASAQNSDGFRPSRALNTEERLRWFNKLVRYYLYGVNPATMNIPGPFQYLTDTGMWNDSNFRKYNASGKFGYELSDRVEAGISARFMYGSASTSTYQNRCISDYHIETLSWNEPIFNFIIPNQLKKSALVNRSFLWPEKYNFTVSPYLKAEYKIFSIKAQGFYYRNSTKQDGFLDNEHFFSKDASAVQSQSAAYLDPFYDYHIYESYGIQAYPSFRLASWNRLTMAALWRTDTLSGLQSAISFLKSPDIARYYGTSQFSVNFLKADFVTVAIEDEISVRDRLRITAGVSYDAQDFTIHKARDPNYAYIYANAYIVKSNSMIWGTRDSFNPVAGVIYDVVQDLLRLKTAFSMKTRFPLLGDYEKVSSILYDRGLKPERSFNYNAGFQLYFLDKSLTFGSDYFFSIIKNRIAKIAGGDEPPVNVSRIDTHGVETEITYQKKKIANVFDIEAGISYTYLYARNRDTSWEETANMGKYIEDTPAHQVIADIRLSFKTGTYFGIWGTALMDEVMYAMRARPNPAFPSFYSRKLFTPVKLHNQFNLNMKISQEIWRHFTVYVLFKNILDDYNPDPFNPGPGFMFYGGFEAKL